MLAADAEELEEVLEQGKELVLAFAIGHEHWEEDWEIAGLHNELSCDFPRHLGFIAQFIERDGVLEDH